MDFAPNHSLLMPFLGYSLTLEMKSFSRLQLQHSAFFFFLLASVKTI